MPINLYPRNRISEHKVKRFIATFYVVGAFGFLIPLTKELFITITPIALLLNTYLLAIYHNKYSLKAIAVFTLIFLLGFFIEVIGVNTGLIFGSYQYGSGLGVKIFDTPLLIGVNWLFLTYACSSVLHRLRINKNLSVIMTALLMLGYDLILEQVAPKMDMWHWEGGLIPIQNYMAWFAIALLFAALLRFFRINLKNSLSGTLLIAQFIFFVVLMFILK